FIYKWKRICYELVPDHIKILNKNKILNNIQNHFLRFSTIICYRSIPCIEFNNGIPIGVIQYDIYLNMAEGKDLSFVYDDFENKILGNKIQYNKEIFDTLPNKVKIFKCDNNNSNDLFKNNFQWCTKCYGTKEMMVFHIDKLAKKFIDLSKISCDDIIGINKKTTEILYKNDNFSIDNEVDIKLKILYLRLKEMEIRNKKEIIGIENIIDNELICKNKENSLIDEKLKRLQLNLNMLKNHSLP